MAQASPYTDLVPATHPERPDRAEPVRETSEALLIALMRTFRLLKRVPDQPIEPAQIWLLHTLHCHGPVRMSDLAARLQLDVSTVSRQVRVLEQSGQIERSPDPDDGRATVLTATATGLQVLNEAVERRHALLAAVLKDWSPDDLATLGTLLSRLGDSLAEDHTESSS